VARCSIIHSIAWSYQGQISTAASAVKLSTAAPPQVDRSVWQQQQQDRCPSTTCAFSRKPCESLPAMSILEQTPAAAAAADDDDDG